jgi:hypothetical protein
VRAAAALACLPWRATLPSETHVVLAREGTDRLVAWIVPTAGASMRDPREGIVSRETHEYVRRALRELAYSDAATSGAIAHAVGEPSLSGTALGRWIAAL